MEKKNISSSIVGKKITAFKKAEPIPTKKADKASIHNERHAVAITTEKENLTSDAEVKPDKTERATGPHSIPKEPRLSMSIGEN